MKTIRNTGFIATAIMMLMAQPAAGMEKMAGMNMPASAPTKAADKSSGKKILYYRDPMNPSVTSPKPMKDGMGMDYVPVYATAGAAPGTVALSAERIQQLGVQTATAVRRNLARAIRAVGTVQPDETREVVISPRFSGWIEKLDVDATGMTVKKGEPLFTFYSPELTHIEAEYPFSGSGHANGTIEKLQSLAAPEAEIARLRHKHTVSTHMIFTAPTDGTVLKKMAVEGMKFSPGMTLYNITDLSQVWVIAEVYEQDLSGLAVGQSAQITFTAYPGKIFKGKISFIYPDINPKTRTARVRIALPNPDNLLKLDMYATVEISGTPEKDVLTVPASAVIDSGTQKTVLLALGGGRFLPREVTTGLRAHGQVVILSGLKAGDRVVTAANFLIDSESNLRSALQGFTEGGKK